MKRLTETLQRSGFLAVAAVFGFLLGLQGLGVLLSKHASAAMLTSRSLALSSSANGSITVGASGSGSNGQKAKHTISFTMATSGATVGAVAIIYCTSPIPQTSCTSSTAATGNESNLTSATISGTGWGGSSWALDTATSNATANSALTNYGTCNGSGTTRENCVLLKAGTAGDNTGTPAVTIEYGGGDSNYVTNPTNDNQVFYARIVVFSGNDYTTVVDNGGVANSTGEQIDITARVQEKLNFSVGATYVAPSSTCAALSGGSLNLGDSAGVLDSGTAYDAFSYFRVSTNALNGTAVQYSGDTLKSGSNHIDALASEVLSAPGFEQFGLGLNTDNANHSFTTLSPATGYDEANGNINPTVAAKFNYAVGSVTTPVTIASVGASSPITCDTGAVRYIGNISTTTPPGIYTTTVTYIALPTY